MNGNFEHDKGAYPYTATRIGDNHFVVHTPTQVKVLDTALPLGVAERIALDLNTEFYTHRVRKAFDLTLAEDRRSVQASALESLECLYLQGETFNGARYQQLKDALS